MVFGDRRIVPAVGRTLRRVAVSLQAQILVTLMLLQVILANTKFDELQVVVELVLAFWFILGLVKSKFSASELVLVVVFICSLLISFLSNEAKVAMLGGKVMGLGILSLLYFSKNQVDSRLIVYVFIVNVLMILYWRLTGENLGQSLADDAGGSWAGLTGRPLGLFMSAHVTAYYCAIFLIYILYRRFSMGVGLIVLWATTSLFTLISYAAQLLNTQIYTRFRSLYYVLGIFFSVNVVALLMVGFEGTRAVLMGLGGFLGESFGIGPDRIMGIGVIFDQFFGPATYNLVFTFFPSDYNNLLSNWVDDFGNEIMFFTYMQHAGFILLVPYLYQLVKMISHYAIFAFVALFHYGDVTTPLFVYMMVFLSAKMAKSDKISKS